MKISFFGAARTTTGSMHLLEAEGLRILLDCGLMQGKRKEAFERNRTFPFEPGAIDYVVLSHAHVDHSGNLPTLVRRGFRGTILATPATRDLCDIMLRDTAFLQEKDVLYVNRKRERQGKRPFEPLYTIADVDPTMKRFRPVAYGESVTLSPGITIAFHDAGHILGSASVTIDFQAGPARKRLFFTGDMGRPNMPILRDPEVVTDVDFLITESTYGDRVHPPMADVQGRLKAFMEDINAQHAKLIVPCFSVGRTQQLVYYLHEIYEKRRIANVPVFVDSPLSSRATDVYERHRECYDREAVAHLLDGESPFTFRGLKYITSVEESIALNSMPGPAMIISASGMCEGGRILHHLKNNIEDPRNIVLFVGFQAQNTLGRRIVDRVSPVTIFGEPYKLNARVHTINALSAHADRNELADYFTRMGPKVERAFVVHGEEQACANLAADLRHMGARDVLIPACNDSAEIG